jgi:hypothetical protein
MELNETRAWRYAAAEAHKQSVEQRKLILTYPDIAAKLCQAPFGYAEPLQWTGFIPPPYESEGPGGMGRPNRSPYRAALLALLEEAAERADGEQQAVQNPW